MADATRDARLRLDLDTAQAVRGMESVVKVGEQVERQLERTEQAAEKANEAIAKGGDGAASAASRTIERYGPEGLSRSEMRRQRRSEAAWDKRHDNAQAALDQYRLDKHYSGIRAERQRRQDWDATHDDAMKRLEAYRLGTHYDRIRAERKSQAEQAQARSLSRDGRFSDHIAGRMAGLGGRGLPGIGSLQGMLRGGIAGLGIGAGIAGINRIGNMAAESFELAGNRDLTGAQKWNATIDDLTFGVSKTLRRFQEAVDGTAEFMRTTQYRMQRDATRNDIAARNQSELYGRQAAQDSAGLRAAYRLRAGSGPLEAFDRATIGGQLAHEEQMARYGAADAAAGAATDAQIARGEYRSAQRRFNEGSDAYAVERDRRARLQARVVGLRGREDSSGIRNKREIQATLESLADATTRERHLFEQREQLRRDLERSGVNAAQAEHRARQAVIEQTRVEIELLGAREQRLSAAATRLGSMTGIDRVMGLDAARAVRDRGMDGVTPEIRQLAQQFAPEWFRQQAERFGEGTAEYRAARAEGFEIGGTDSLADIRGEQTRLQQSARQAMIDSTNRMATEISDAVDRGMRGVAAILNERIDQALRELQQNRWRQSNQQN